MINLLPSDIKEDLLYGRRNSHLRGWLFAFGFSLLGVGLIVAGGALYMESSIASTQAKVDASRTSLAAQKPEETGKRLEEISANTKLILQVLSKEILFSGLLKQLGASVPANTVLLDFQLDKIQGALSLKAVATDIQAATQLQLNLADPKNKIFEKADIESISCNPDPKIKYPCTVQLRALFAKDNPFVYITATPQKKPTGGDINQ